MVDPEFELVVAPKQIRLVVADDTLGVIPAHVPVQPVVGPSRRRTTSVAMSVVDTFPGARPQFLPPSPIARTAPRRPASCRARPAIRPSQSRPGCPCLPSIPVGRTGSRPAARNRWSSGRSLVSDSGADRLIRAFAQNNTGPALTFVIGVPSGSNASRMSRATF